MATLAGPTLFSGDTPATTLESNYNFIKHNGSDAGASMVIHNDPFAGSSSVENGAASRKLLSRWDEADIAFPVEQWAESPVCVHTSFGPDWSVWGGPCIHTPKDITQYQGWLIGINTSTLYLRRHSGLATATTFASKTGFTGTTAATRLRIELHGAYAAGGVLKGFVDDIEELSYVLTAPDLFGGAGQPGMLNFDAGGTRQNLQDWKAGDFVSAPAGITRALQRTALVRSGLTRPDLNTLPHEMDEFV